VYVLISEHTELSLIEIGQTAILLQTRETPLVRNECNNEKFDLKVIKSIGHVGPTHLMQVGVLVTAQSRFDSQTRFPKMSSQTDNSAIILVLIYKEGNV
jgi:hypothetical protein